jgi:hypothetical protein
MFKILQQNFLQYFFFLNDIDVLLIVLSVKILRFTLEHVGTPELLVNKRTG